MLARQEKKERKQREDKIGCCRVNVIQDRTLALEILGPSSVGRMGLEMDMEIMRLDDAIW
jgi:hypothetical protein